MRDHTITKDQHTAIFNSTQNYYPNPPGQWSNITVADHLSTDASMHIDGKLEVQGRDVLKELDEMRDALLLLKRDVDMEAKYPKLKELKDAYEEQLEKYKTFEALK
jgi:hypothetical protein